jgi:aminopeptidase N
LPERAGLAALDIGRFIFPMSLLPCSITVAAALLIIAFIGCRPAQQKVSTPETPTQLPRTARPVHYSISVVPYASNLRFSGSVVADIEVLQQTDAITLNAAELDFQSVVVTDSANKNSDGKASLNPGAQTATFQFSSRLAPGQYRLAINYTGKINLHATGLFALDYDAPEGQKRALFTQFEASDARRFFPCWDEPSFRAPIDLRVTVPAGQNAIGNMPQAGHTDKPDGTSEIAFATTPAMSSYLLFLAVGEFDRITTMAAQTEIGVVTKKGDGEKGRWALEGAAQILPYYNDYFGVPYPLPKLDNIAGPGSSQFFGAMENWGAIFSFESILLNDPSITSEDRRQAIFKVAAHEMAHQWFGDLVTMAWWNDLWLNEGFASWMGNKATTVLHPEWDAALELVGSRESAMNLDSFSTSHPVVQNITTVEQTSQAFDAITYNKGAAVLTMLEDYVGENIWRQGVRDYITTYRLKNTVTDNLWDAVEHAAGKPVTAIAHDFTLQPGVPLIRIEEAVCSDGNTKVTLRQEEFSRDNPKKQPLRWRVPVIASTLGGPEQKTLVTDGSGSLTVAGCEPLIVNSGQTGYYRTFYPAALLDRLKASYTKLNPVDQIGLLADNWGLGLAGYESAATALDFIDAIPADANPELWSRAARILIEIYDDYEGDTAGQERLSHYASAKLGPVLKRLTWASVAGEKPKEAVLRAELIGALGQVGDPEVVAEAKRRYDSGDPSAISGPLRTSILDVVARRADVATWERLHTQAQAEKSPLVRNEFYKLLGRARDKTLVQRALDIALTTEPGPTTSSQIIGAVAEVHPDLAFDFAIQNRDKVEGLVDVSSRSRYLPRLAGRSSEPAMTGKLEDYAQHYLTPQSRKSADVAIAQIRDRIRVRQDRLPDITAWLTAHSS